MTSRNRYHKVKGACQTCKARKVRCTLERPVCHNCQRLDRPCSYLNAPNLNQTSHITPNSSSQSSNFASPPLEVRLIHQFTAFTASALTANPTLIALWRDVVPTIAFRHPWLLHAIYAVAAQHLLHSLPPSREPEERAALEYAASRYHQEALAMYIRELDDIREENCEALFCFSQIVVGMSYVRLVRGKDNEVGVGVIEGMVEIMELLKGTLTVAERASGWLNKGVLEPMMGNDVKEVSEEAVDGPAGCREALGALRERIVGWRSRKEGCQARINVLCLTIEMIHKLLCSDLEGEDRLNKVVGLPIWIDSGFTGLLKAGDQAALAILAYYGVAISMTDSVWFLERVGRSIVRAVVERLSEEWVLHISWPISQVTVR